jgi:phospholipase C
MGIKNGNTPRRIVTDHEMSLRKLTPMIRLGVTLVAILIAIPKSYASSSTFSHYDLPTLTHDQIDSNDVRGIPEVNSRSESANPNRRDCSGLSNPIPSQNGEMGAGLESGITDGISLKRLTVAALGTTSTTLAASQNPSNFGQVVTFTATVSAMSGMPTGNVTFKNGTTALGTVALTGGVATLTTSALSVGTDSITAVYKGSTAFSGSTSSVLSQVVDQVASAVALTSSLNPSTIGQAVTFTATVSALSGTPAGNVTFKNGSATLGTAALAGGVAILTTPLLSVGTDSITAVYKGSAAFSGSTSSLLSQVVDQGASMVALTSSPNPSTVGQAVTFTATVSALSGTPTGNVTFKNGTTTLGTVSLTGGVATLTTAALIAGTESITAVYKGSAAFSGSTSALLSQVVDEGTSTVALTSSLNPSTFGQAVTFTATVSSLSGTPTGNVTFKNGRSTLGTAALAGGVATLTTAALDVGTDSITAVYKGSTAFSGSTSSVLSQVVDQVASAVALTSSLNPSTIGQAVTFTATVSSLSGAATGTIMFENGSVILDTAVLTGGVATIVTSLLPAGTLAITSAYSGSKNVGASSATLTQTVNPVGSSSYSLTATALNPNWFTPGTASTSSVQVTPANGYAGNVNLVCSTITGGTPPPNCAFNPSSVTISGTTPGNSTLTVSTSGSTPANNFTISVTGSDANNLSPSNGAQAVSLTAVPVGSSGYILSATALNPSSVTSGSMSAATVTVIPANGYAGNVNLSCTTITGGTSPPSCAFNPSAVTISGTTPGTSTLTVSTSSSTSPGSYTISVAGSDANNMAPINGSQALILNTAAVIQHVVIIFQENRTPDNLFQDPVLIARGADIASSGINSLGQTVSLSPIDLGTSGSNPSYYDLDHSHTAFVAMYDGGKMDGADLIACSPNPNTNCPPNPQFMYVNPTDVQPYYALAEQYSFGDRMFQSNQGPSFPAHQFIISGTSAPTATSPLFAAENPIPLQSNEGCISPLNTLATMIDATGSETNPAPQYPCFEHPTLTDLLDTQGVTWRYYVGALAGAIWTGPEAIEHMCQQQIINGALACTGPDWINNVIMPQSQVLTDIANGQLAQVSWIIPDGNDSDHPQTNDGSGPSWVASIVNAIGNSGYWANTAIIITWDDWGGWYDHVAPKVINDDVSWGSGYVYGFRVPLIVVSPYAKSAYISHITHDFGSVLKFIETTFNLPSLGYADAAADDLSDCFNLAQTPLTFQVIPAPLDAAHFINDKRPPSDPDDY